MPIENSSNDNPDEEELLRKREKQTYRQLEKAFKGSYKVASLLTFLRTQEIRKVSKESQLGIANLIEATSSSFIRFNAFHDLLSDSDISEEDGNRITSAVQENVGVDSPEEN